MTINDADWPSQDMSEERIGRDSAPQNCGNSLEKTINIRRHQLRLQNDLSEVKQEQVSECISDRSLKFLKLDQDGQPMDTAPFELLDNALEDSPRVSEMDTAALLERNACLTRLLMQKDLEIMTLKEHEEAITEELEEAHNRIEDMQADMTLMMQRMEYW